MVARGEPKVEHIVPFDIGTPVMLHGAHGTIGKRKMAGPPECWHYEVRWETGTFGWWGHGRVAEMVKEAGDDG